MFVAVTTRGGAVARLRAALQAAGVAEAGPDARALVAAAVEVRPAALLTGADIKLGTEAADRLAEFARRRIARAPVGRILGTRAFWNLEIRLSPETLEPRADTETVVETAIDEVADRAAPLRILDLGTGSGCILLALLAELPAATGLGLDRVPGALATARLNAEAAGLGGRALFAASDWAAAIDARFDLVVGNPPYIARPELANLAPEVRDHDPAEALDGGPDGLDAYRAILPDLPRLLTPRAVAILEIGHDQAASLIALAAASAALGSTVGRDLGGRDRALVLRHAR